MDSATRRHLTTVAEAASTPLGVTLSARQKQQFIDALVSTSYDDLEAGFRASSAAYMPLSRISVCTSWPALHTARDGVSKRHSPLARTRQTRFIRGWGVPSVTRERVKRLCLEIHIYSTIVRSFARGPITTVSITRTHLTNRWSQPLAAVKSTFEFTKQFSIFATLALASGG